MPETETADEQQLEGGPQNGSEGAGLVTLAWAGTGCFVATSIVATIWPDAAAVPASVLDCLLFVVGVVAFLWAYAIAIGRSRTEEISIAGIYFLAGTAPKVVRFRLRLAIAVEVVAAVVSASIRPYTAVAFGVLVPMFGLGLAGLWGARHGSFPARREPTA